MYQKVLELSTAEEKGSRSSLFYSALAMLDAAYSLRRTGTAIDPERIAHSKRVALAGFVSHVTGIEVSIHGVLQWRAHKVLQTVRHVRQQEPAVGVSQEVVHGVTTGDRTIVLQGIDIIVRSSNALLSFEMASC